MAKITNAGILEWVIGNPSGETFYPL